MSFPVRSHPGLTNFLFRFFLISLDFTSIWLSRIRFNGFIHLALAQAPAQPQPQRDCGSPSLVMVVIIVIDACAIARVDAGNSPCPKLVRGAVVAWTRAGWRAGRG